MVGNLLLTRIWNSTFFVFFFFFFVLSGEREGGNDDDSNAVYISVLEGDKRKICNVEQEESDGSL